jgi:hypothetical protein
MVGAKRPRLVSHALGRSMHADLIAAHLGVLPHADVVARPPFENADLIGYVMVCDENRGQAEALADHFVAGARVLIETPVTPSMPRVVATC